MPLTAHCLVHATLTLLIVFYYNKTLWSLAILDFVTHFAMDRIKASPRYLGRWTDTSKAPFWIAFGTDQLVHHLTHIYIIWVIVKSLPPPV